MRGPQRGKTPRKKTRANSSPEAEVEPVEVYCRIRPLDNPNSPVCVKVLGNDIVQLSSSENTAAFARTGQLKEVQYKFGHVFDDCASQKAVFDYAAKPMIDDLLHGKNGLLFTYGVTSSGKTYTMTGGPQNQGILPRCLDMLFNSITDVQAKKYVFKSDKMNGFEVQSEADAMMERQRRDILPGLTPRTPGTPRVKEKSDFGKDSGRIVDPTRIQDIDEDNTYAVFVSYIEIYNNSVFDLLEELQYDNITGYKPPQSKILRTDGADSMYVMNATEVEIKCPEEAFEVLFKGQKRRKVAHTALNAESSRSHSIFNIRLVQAPLDGYGQEVIQDNDKIILSQLSLVDLAGSERTNRTKNQGDRLKEAGNINQTLMALRSCLECLRENQQSPNNRKLVPYRDSKLTHLFKNYFDGNGRVRMIVCVNPLEAEYDETVQVMKFSEMSQEVMIQRSQQVTFDLGLTPGRRRLGEKLREERMKEEAENARREAENAEREEFERAEREAAECAPSPSVFYSLGPDFPNLQMRDCNDSETLKTLIAHLEDRDARRQALIADFVARQERFRPQLVAMVRELHDYQSRSAEIDALSSRHDSVKARLESQCRSLEHKVSALQQQLGGAERRLKQYEAAEYDRKMESRTFRTPATASKPRHYTTPGVLLGARSESDVSSIGTSAATRSSKLSATPTPRPWGYNGSRPVPKTPVAAPKTPVPTPRSVPHYNFRHRRSKSNNETWLDHRPNGRLEMDTVLQPTLKKKKSVTRLETKDTRSHSKYMLTHQGVGSDGESYQTKYFKGDVIPTSTGGAAVVFTDVEIHAQKEAGSRKRRSSCPQPTDFDGQWTDPEERCAIAIEGHRRKRSRQSPEIVSRV